MGGLILSMRAKIMVSLYMSFRYKIVQMRQEEMI